MKVRPGNLLVHDRVLCCYDRSATCLLRSSISTIVSIIGTGVNGLFISRGIITDYKAYVLIDGSLIVALLHVDEGTDNAVIGAELGLDNPNTFWWNSGRHRFHIR